MARADRPAFRLGPVTFGGRPAFEAGRVALAAQQQQVTTAAEAARRAAEEAAAKEARRRLVENLIPVISVGHLGKADQNLVAQAQDALFGTIDPRTYTVDKGYERITDPRERAKAEREEHGRVRGAMESERGRKRVVFVGDKEGIVFTIDGNPGLHIDPKKGDLSLGKEVGSATVRVSRVRFTEGTVGVDTGTRVRRSSKVQVVEVLGQGSAGQAEVKLTTPSEFNFTEAVNNAALVKLIRGTRSADGMEIITAIIGETPEDSEMVSGSLAMARAFTPLVSKTDEPAVVVIGGEGSGLKFRGQVIEPGPLVVRRRERSGRGDRAGSQSPSSRNGARF